MRVNSQTYKTKKIENDNLLSFMQDLYTDTKNLGCNIRLLGECLAEWQDTKIILEEAHNEHQVPAGDVRPPLGVWTISDSLFTH